jgi:hypothetical protein
MSRFAFIPRTLTSIGAPVRYDVVEGNAGSNAGGKRVGYIMYDGVLNAWFFKIDEKLPNISVSDTDATQISVFIAALARPVDLINEG